MRILPEIVRRTAANFPHKTAVEDTRGRLTYRDAFESAQGLARRLRERHGVRGGSPVFWAFPPCREFFVVYWGTLLAGGVGVPLNHRLGEGEQETILNRAPDATVLYHDSLKRYLSPAAFGREPRPVAVRGMEDLPPDRRARLPHIGRKDRALIVHTSGTTGEPKGAVVTHEDLLMNLRVSLAAHGFRHEDVILAAHPVYHCASLYTFIPAAGYCGATVILSDPDPGEVAGFLAGSGVTVFPAVPSMLEMLIGMEEGRGLAGRPLRWIAYAGSPMPARAIARLREIFPGAELRNFYGMTETLVPTHMLPGGDAATHPDSIGKLLPEVSACILDENGGEAPAGATGEMAIHRSCVIREYWKQPELLERAMTGDWFCTGDLAAVDAQGYYTLRGRRKEMIIVGGENVYAGEVERILLDHPRIAEAAVVGVPATGVRRALGELVKAFVVVAGDREVSPLDVRRHCTERGLATYKVPQLVEFRPALPRNAMGKVLKRDLA
jgi:acyl-CoA synthetase (AMP-forming)/AMP-acid ligase II